MPSVSPITTINIKDLFDESRYPSGLRHVLFLLYLPIGLTIICIRLFVGLHFILLVTSFSTVFSLKKITIKAITYLFGIIVHEDYSSVACRDESVSYFVSNHRTVLDSLAFCSIAESLTPKPKYLPENLAKYFGCKDFKLSEGFVNFAAEIRKHFNSGESEPLLLLPEGTTTNGRVGLLMFQPELLNDVQIVQPLALEVWRPPIGFVEVTALNTPWWSDLFWFLFVPFTVFTIKYLPTERRSENETDEEFSKRIASKIGKSLKIAPTPFKASEKAELEKRLFERPPVVRRTASTRTNVRNNTNTINTELQRMRAQVSEVLPYVPHHVIVNDLRRTQSVDITISNILEGHVEFIPLREEPSPTPSTSKIQTRSIENTTNTTSNNPVNIKIGQTCSLDTSAPNFPRSAHDRALSFAERKQRLIENARRRYIEKNGIKLAGISI